MFPGFWWIWHSVYLFQTRLTLVGAIFHAHSLVSLKNLSWLVVFSVCLQSRFCSWTKSNAFNNDFRIYSTQYTAHMCVLCVAVRNCSFRFDTNNSVWQAFISKPITISIMGKLDFETNTENEIAIWTISISIPISILKSPNFGQYFESISISKPIFYYISPPKCWP